MAHHFTVERRQRTNFASSCVVLPTPKTTKSGSRRHDSGRFWLNLGRLRLKVWRMHAHSWRSLPYFLAYFLAGAILLASGLAAAVAQNNVDLALVLAVDTSGSVDAVRFDLQKRGYVPAFRHAHAPHAIRSSPSQAIAGTMLHCT